MIKVNHLKRGMFYINCEHIEQIEETPDTVLTMASGRKILVAEPADEIIRLTMQYKRKVHTGEHIRIK